MTCISCNNMNKLGEPYCSPCQDKRDREVRIDQAKADYHYNMQAIPEGPIKDALEALFTLIEENET